MKYILPLYSFFFFNDTATTEIYTLSLHDALPICPVRNRNRSTGSLSPATSLEFSEFNRLSAAYSRPMTRSEEHTSELQSHLNLVCRLLLEKKKQQNHNVVTGINSAIVTARPTNPP